MGAQMIAGRPEATFTGASIDSRTVAGGELFFALAGSRSDGHAWVDAALAAGAAGAVVERTGPAPAAEGEEAPTFAALGAEGRGTLLLVDDAYAALHDLTRAVRTEVPEKLIGLTGSAGKTTTKELLAAMLARRYRVAKSPGNLNNLYGFPLSLLAIPDDSEWMVAEMGMSEPGELGRLSRLARPDVALLLNVRPAHLEFFGSLAAIAEAKAEILEGLAPGGLLVANADDPEVRRVAVRHGGPIVWFGRGEGAAQAGEGAGIRPTVRADGIEPLADEQPGYRFRLVAGDESLEVVCPLHGRHNVDNALAAAACAHALGVGLADVRDALATAEPTRGRGRVVRLAGPVTLIDDAYNSNPEALARALEAAAELGGRRRWAVLGDMLELGPEGPRFHSEAGALAATSGFDPVVGVGDLARHLTAAAAAAGARTAWFDSAPDAAAWAAREVRPGDVVLVKGSRGVALDRVVDALENAAAPEEASDVL